VRVGGQHARCFLHRCCGNDARPGGAREYLARAQSADLAIADKTPKVRKDKAKPVKKPDKNQYWLLNPTSPDQMRSFNTDRPTKANVPYTVDAGHFQYETDLVNFTHQVTGSVHTDTVLSPNPTFKVGVTNNADLEVNVPFAGVHTSVPRPNRRAACGGSATRSCGPKSTCGETTAARAQRP